MLKSLKIKNIALIEELLIEFDNGLNVLTGETGAGKSIIIDSLAFVLGARSDKTLIRQGQSSARVEAIFQDFTLSDDAKKLLEDMEIDIQDGLLIVRTMSLDGKSDTKLNGTPITLSLLRKITSTIVDIYGQQEQVGLLHSKNQLELLDSFGFKTIQPILTLYKSLYGKIKDINSKLDEFGGDEQNYEREKDYLRYVVEEIEHANLSSEEETALIDDKVKLSNIEKVISSTTTVENTLSSVTANLSNGLSALSSVTHFDANLEQLKNRLESVKLELDDIQDWIVGYNRADSFSEKDLDNIETRLEQYKKLKRKYGTTCEEVLAYLQSSKQKLFELENREQLRQELNNQKKSLLQDIFAVGSNLIEARKNVANNLCDKIRNTLTKLGMPNCAIAFNFFNTELVENNLQSNGIGQVEILFNANLGGVLNPLNKVASGGELSRFMLAIKSIVAEKDTISTMVFDEIDTGISGKMAQAMSEKMAEISKYNQVLAITHSVQIASMADSHFLIRKQEDGGKTISMVDKLTPQERITEISRFISGDSITNSSIKMAEELLASQAEYRKKLS